MLLPLTAVFLLSVCQEPSSIPGAYRGPYDRTLLELTTYQPSFEGDSGTPHYAVGYSSAWDSWEFWFENERDVLFRGKPDFPARAVREDGTYGSEDWAVARQELLLTSMPLLLEALKSDTPAVREAAALSLGRIGYQASRPFLERATKDPVESVRQAAYMGLGLLASEQGTKFLIDNFEENPDLESRAFAAIGLGLSGRVEAGSALKAYLNEVYYDGTLLDQQDLLSACMLAAGVQGSNDYTPLLTRIYESVQDSAHSTRLQTIALQALGAIGDRRARVVLEGALESRHPGVPEAAAQALGRLGDKGAVGQLAKVARESKETRLRSLSLLAIGRLGGHQAEQVLKEIRPTQKEEQALHAAWAISAGLAGYDGAYSELVMTLKHGTDVRQHDDMASPRRDEEVLRGAAAIALGLYGAPGATSQLQGCLEVDNLGPEYCGYLATGLGLLRRDAADLLLLELAAQEDLAPATRRGLAAGLGLANSEKTSVALVKMLIEDENDGVRWAASRALATSRSSAALEALTAQLRQELSQEIHPEQVAHLVLGLGFLGDTHSGATVASMIAGMDYRQENPLVGTLGHY